MSEHPKSLMISGESGAGKSVSLRNIRGPEGVIYFNCESGKPLPFKNKFKKITVTDPEEIIDYLDQLIERQKDPEKSNPFHTGVIDTVSFMMDMYERVHVSNAANTQSAWGAYGNFFRRLMDKIAELDMFFILIGHLAVVTNEDTGEVSSAVPVKGALAKKGLEAYFTTVLNARKVPLKELKKYDGKLLKITSRDEELGYKHVLQTRTTKQTVGDRIRTPMGLFEDDDVYIDNDAQVVIDQLTEYYSET